MIILETIGLKDYISLVSIDKFFWILLLIIFIDVITGLTNAVVEGNLNSSIGLNGFIRHSLIIFIVFIFGLVSFWLQQDILFHGLTLFYTFFYAISVIENLSILGVPFPESLKNKIYELKDENNNLWR